METLVDIAIRLAMLFVVSLLLGFILAPAGMILLLAFNKFLELTP